MKAKADAVKRRAARGSHLSQRGAERANARAPAQRAASHENASVEKILNGALLAISRRGAKKLTMGAIGEAAGVSRGTLYRYFATKEEVLTALSEAVSRTFENGVASAAAAEPDIVARARAVLEFEFALALHEQSSRILEVEPEFVTNFLRSHFERHIAAMQSAMSAPFDQLEAAAGVKLDRRLFAEALVRMELSTMLVPGDARWNRFPQVFAQLLQTAERTSAGRAKRPGGK